MSILDLFTLGIGMPFGVVFIIWRILIPEPNAKSLGKKRNTKKYKYNLLSFTATCLFIYFFYLAKKVLELPFFLGLEYSSYFIFKHDIISGLIYFFILLFFISYLAGLGYVFALMIMNSIEKYFNQKFNKSNLVEQYRIYRNKYEYSKEKEIYEVDVAHISQLSLRKIFIFNLFGNKRGLNGSFQDVETDIVSVIWFVFTFVLFFSISPFFYDGILSDGLFSYRDFIDNNSNNIQVNTLRNYWLFIIWLATRILILITIYFIVHYSVQFIKILKESRKILTYSKAEYARVNNDFKTAIPLYEKIINSVSNPKFMYLANRIVAKKEELINRLENMKLEQEINE